MSLVGQCLISTPDQRPALRSLFPDRCAIREIRQMGTMPMRVFVTGAGGRTGRIVYDKLASRPEFFKARGLVRREEQKQELGHDPGVVVGDILKSQDLLKQELSQTEKLVILTSAVPKMKAPPADGKRPEFYFEDDGMPEQVLGPPTMMSAVPALVLIDDDFPMPAHIAAVNKVLTAAQFLDCMPLVLQLAKVDWIGQKTQVDLAKECGVQHVVVVGSLGYTKKSHPLNSIGNGNILLWKKKAEEYLMDSGLPYTIIHAGGLLDRTGGLRKLKVGNNDEFLGNASRSIPRADVAEVVVQALSNQWALNKCFDLISDDEGHGKPTVDFDELFSQAEISFKRPEKAKA